MKGHTIQTKRLAGWQAGRHTDGRTDPQTQTNRQICHSIRGYADAKHYERGDREAERKKMS